jgi:hypothetical protein
MMVTTRMTSLFDGGDDVGDDVGEDGYTCRACDADCILDFTSSKSNNIFIDSDVFCST